MESTISFDESGNTGQDLLNKDQKAFVLASVCFADEETDKLQTIFKDCAEIHFKNLRKSKAGREQILEFINHELITEQNIMCSISNKEYVVVAQIIDQLVETFLHKNNIDIYQYGLNLTYTNSFYYFGKFLWNKELFHAVLRSFVQMIRDKDEQSVIDFYSALNSLYNDNDTKESEILIPIIYSSHYIDEILKAVDKFTLDVTLPSFMVICDKWYNKTGNKLRVHFDNSKQIEYYKDYVEFTRTINSEKVEVGYGSRVMTFPTQIESLELVDSENNISIQFADLIASTIAFMYNNKNPKQEPFVEEIRNSKLLELSNYHIIWPAPKVTPEDLEMTDGNGINMLDFLAQKITEMEK